MTKAEDPAHEGWAVDQQVAGGAEGYVRNYARTHPDVADKGLVLGYHTHAELPVYVFLAEHFCVCDRCSHFGTGCDAARTDWTRRGARRASDSFRHDYTPTAPRSAARAPTAS